MKRRASFKIAAAAAIATAVTLLSWAGLSANVFFGTQLRLSDALFPSNAVDPRIVIVAIDQRSIDEIGQWPWDRTEHAQLIDDLSAGGASAVGYDVSFFVPSTKVASDAALAGAIQKAGNVVLVSTAHFSGKPADILRATGLDDPLAALRTGAVAVSHANVFPDTDGVVRVLPPVIESPDGTLLPSMSLALAEIATGQAGQPITTGPDGVRVGDLFVPTGPAHLMNIDYVPETAFPVYSAIDVLSGAVPTDAFRGKIVLVGATALGLGDQLPTPIDKANKQPGVEVQADALNTMLTGNYLFPVSMGSTLLWVFVLAFALALAVAFLPIVASLVIGLAIFAGYFAFAIRWFGSGHVVNMVYAPLGVILAYFAGLALKYLTEVRERKYVTKVFGRYLAKDVVQEVLSSPQAAVATLKGVSRPLGVLFADLRGFTAASEKATPPEVVAALNVYLEAMTRAVVEERGTIDKFMGDCVMAFWGAPRPDPDYAVRAVRAAMRMQDYIDEAMDGGPASVLKVKGCGVGVSAGEAVVGNIGSHERLDYTAIGDTVNTASRLCGVAGQGEIVVTEECARFLNEGFLLSELPPLSVKGKSLPLRVFQVLRPGQEPKVFIEGDVLDLTEEKGHFEPVPAPPKVAGYAPVEPVSSSSSTTDARRD